MALSSLATFYIDRHLPVLFMVRLILKIHLKVNFEKKSNNYNHLLKLINTFLQYQACISNAATQRVHAAMVPPYVSHIIKTSICVIMQSGASEF